MVQGSPGDSPTPPAEGRRLGGGAIASLSGIGLLVIFMVQNTERVRLDFLFWHFSWPLAPDHGLGDSEALVWFGLGVMRRQAPRGASPRPRGLGTCQQLTSLEPTGSTSSARSSARSSAGWSVG